MKIINVFILFIAVFLTAHCSFAMEAPSEQAKKLTDEEKVSQGLKKLAMLASNWVSEEFLQTVVFKEDNTFEVGEIVVIPSHLYANFYACITKIESDPDNPSRVLIQVRTNEDAFIGAISLLPVRSIGKLKKLDPPPCLRHVGFLKVITLIKQGRIQYEDLANYQVPSELLAALTKLIFSELQKQSVAPQGWQSEGPRH